MRRTRLWALALLLAAAGQLAAQPKILDKGAELARLDFLVGEWTGTVERSLPDGGVLAVEPRVRIEWGLGGVWLHTFDTVALADGSTIHNLTLMTWDAHTGSYVGTWQDNVNPENVAFRGRWVDGDTLELDSGTFEFRGTPMRMVTTWRRVGDAQLRLTLRRSIRDGELREIGRGTLRRAGVPAARAAGVRVRYVANEGFLLEGGGRKVLIDALLDGGIRGYPTPSAAMQESLEHARAPFDGVDLVLVTHHHADHFGPRCATDHLRANPTARLVSTPQVVDELRRVAGDDAALAGRIEAVYPDEGERVTLTRGGVTVHVLNLHHGRDREPPVQNLGFLIELGGVKVLHIGDTEGRVADFGPYRLAAESIDVALLPVWYLVHEHWIEVVRREIRPREIVAMHLPTPDAPPGYFSLRGSYEALLATLRRNFPEARLPGPAGTTASFAPRATAASSR